MKETNWSALLSFSLSYERYGVGPIQFRCEVWTIPLLSIFNPSLLASIHRQHHLMMRRRLKGSCGYSMGWIQGTSVGPYSQSKLFIFFGRLKMAMGSNFITWFIMYFQSCVKNGEPLDWSIENDVILISHACLSCFFKNLHPVDPKMKIQTLILFLSDFRSPCIMDFEKLAIQSRPLDMRL